MSKFVIECPVCHNYNAAKTGFFASKRIKCACGHTIDVRTDAMKVRRCSHCGNDVVSDQRKGTDEKCPVCGKALYSGEMLKNYVQFPCPTCGCQLQAKRDAQTITCPICDTSCDVVRQQKIAQMQEQGLPAVIRCECDENTLVWKHPLTDFVMGSQLIVHETQEAIFFRNGEALDSFPAGRYDLDTGVLPKMNKLVSLPVTGQPFHAEIYFVNLVTLMNIKWGTASKVGMFDPISGIHVELGAFGTFNIRVTEPRRLLMRLVGTMDQLDRDQLFGGETGYFRTLIMTQVKTNLARVIKENHINILEVDAHIDVLSARLRDAINDGLQEYGLTAPEFYISDIATPDDDPNFRRLKQQHAELYLRRRQEEIEKEVAEATFERRAVEAQTEARMKMIGAQGDAEALKIKAAAEAEAYRLQAEAEAQEMRLKGYTYQQESQRQIGLAAMEREGGSGAGNMAGNMVGNLTGIAGDVMSLGVGLGAVGSVMGMTKEVMQPIAGAMQDVIAPAAGWNCACGQANVTGNFCPNCGAKRPEPGWRCACGQANITSNFCPNCGAKRPEPGWSCECGQTNITGNFCPNCGKGRN